MVVRVPLPPDPKHPAVPALLELREEFALRAVGVSDEAPRAG